ncbi:conserved hypothetical protein [gamma proteobacterium HTCC5015]|nr:conserved hypothetical protein [gamma proteobacterium HTCC5015]
MIDTFKQWLDSPKVQAAQFKALLNAYPPYVGAGIRTRHVSTDFTEIDVELVMSWYNKNYFGTHFGGSLYAMVDPFYCLMLSKQIGRGYMTWDKGAEIDFVAPGKGTVRAEFRLSVDEVENIRREAESGRPLFPEFDVDIVDVQNKTVAKVKKTLYVRKKR